MIPISPEQQFDIWYFSAVSGSQQQAYGDDLDILTMFDKAFELASATSHQQLSRALQTATALALAFEQPEKMFTYVKLWKTFATELPIETRFYVAVAHYQLQQYDLSSKQLESLITQIENQGQDPKQSWLGLLVGSYSEQGHYAKAYEVQQKAEALYPSEKKPALISRFKTSDTKYLTIKLNRDNEPPKGLPLSVRYPS